MSTYCAPCLADLALLREAVTSVSGTAACVAHAVLLLHPGDTAPQRLARLSELRSTAESKIATASTDDIPSLELLVQEYALAGAMDMTVPLRDLAGDRTPRPPKTRNRGRDRGRDRERGPRPEHGGGGAEHGGGGAESAHDRPAETPAPSEPASEKPAAEAPAPAQAPAAEAPAPAPAPAAEAPAPAAEAPAAAPEPVAAPSPPPSEAPSEVPAG